MSQPETLMSVARPTTPSLEGSVLVLMLFDTCEEIQLPELNQILGARRLAQAFKHAAPEYVRFERPPVVEQLEPARIDGNLTLNRQIKYYDYGVVSVIFEIPFAGEWEDLVTLSAKWMAGTDFEREAERLARSQTARAQAALIRPYSNWLSEDYFIFNIRAALPEVQPPPNLSRSAVPTSPASYAEKRSTSRTANAQRYCNRAFRTTRQICR